MPPPKRSARFQALLVAHTEQLRRQAGLPATPQPQSEPADAALGADASTGKVVRLGGQERLQGTYILGASGTGKTTLVENLIVDDIERGYGVCVLDPHGDLSGRVLRRMPAHREADVVFLNPLDVAYPFALDIFHCPNREHQLVLERTIDQAVGVFQKLWGVEGSKGSSWGPALEDLLYMSTITLVEVPGATIIELRRLLTDADFRAQLLSHVTNDEVLAFWQQEYDPLRAFDEREYRSRLLNKVRPFITRPTLRNIMGQSQPKKRLSFREFMDSGKVVIVPLNTALLGAGVATLLGSVMVGEILTAALSRQDIPEAARRPFHLFADEFQHFATIDFSQLIAQARKYRVPVHLAHQYLDQLDEQMQAAVLTIGNFVAYRVSSRDAAVIAGQYQNAPGPADTRLEMVTASVDGYELPVKTYDSADDQYGTALYQRVPGPARPYSDVVGERTNELANLPPYTARVKIREGEQLNEYLLKAFNVPAVDFDDEAAAQRFARIVQATRDTYCRPRAEVVAEIRARTRRAPSDQSRPRVVNSEASPATAPAPPHRGITRREPLED